MMQRGHANACSLQARCAGCAGAGRHLAHWRFRRPFMYEGGWDTAHTVARTTRAAFARIVGRSYRVVWCSSKILL
eukprot:6195108-Pleurochrysis_carterae.AAC.2